MFLFSLLFPKSFTDFEVSDYLLREDKFGSEPPAVFGPGAFRCCLLNNQRPPVHDRPRPTACSLLSMAGSGTTA